LIRAAAKIGGIERIRLSSIEVWEIDDDLLSAMTESPKVCRHLHIPLQSGSEQVLQAMHRPYTPDRYSEIVQKAREAIPELGLTTDIIIGFPGETDQAFEESCRFVKQMGFSRLHVFRYSPRPGTAAARMADQVSEQDKTQRSKQMIQIGSTLARRFAERLVGQELPVLVETKRTELLSGLTDNYVEVQFAGSEKLRGKIVPVQIESVAEGVIFGATTDEHR
jgi:threonylcarbamoyladenosine tRNA methylthiotransferase MtaB